MWGSQLYPLAVLNGTQLDPRDSGKSGMGMGMDPPSPANRGRGWGWGWAPDPRQIGDGTPIPIPGQIGDGDGDGDRGFRALVPQAAPGQCESLGHVRLRSVNVIAHGQWQVRARTGVDRTGGGISASPELKVQ